MTNTSRGFWCCCTKKAGPCAFHLLCYTPGADQTPSRANLARKLQRLWPGRARTESPAAVQCSPDVKSEGVVANENYPQHRSHASMPPLVNLVLQSGRT